MSTILRASGAKFDVDSFVMESTLSVNTIYRVGEPVRPTVDPDGRKQTVSGFSVVVSDVDFDDYQRQMKEAHVFLRDNLDEMLRLAAYPGLEALCIDFGADIHPPGWCSFRFPHPLLAMAGKAKVDLELSVYPAETEGDSVSDERIEELNEAYEEFVARRNKPGEETVGGKT